MSKPELKMPSFWDDSFIVLNMSRGVQRRQSHKEIVIETLRATVGRSPTKDELQKLSRIRRANFIVALKELLKLGKVERTGTGSKNDPFRYILAAEHLVKKVVVPKCV
jgi:DNA-directed RNA polymerase specialized sigma subunit